MDVCSFPKNGSEEVRAQLARIGGREVATLRVFETRNGRTFPSRKGLSLAVESLPALADAIQALRVAALDPASFA